MNGGQRTVYVYSFPASYESQSLFAEHEILFQESLPAKPFYSPPFKIILTFSAVGLAPDEFVHLKEISGVSVMKKLWPPIGIQPSGPGYFELSSFIRFQWFVWIILNQLVFLKFLIMLITITCLFLVFPMLSSQSPTNSYCISDLYLYC